MSVNARALDREPRKLFSPSFLRPLAWLVVALACIVVPLYSAKVFNQSSNTDFGVYYRAAIRAKLGQWESLYSPQLDGVSPFRYAPWTLPFFRPFAELSRAQAHVAWFYLQLFFFFMGFRSLWRALRLLTRHKPIATGATMLAGLAILRLCLDTFTIGQTSSLMFWGFAAALLASVRARPRTAALWIWIPASLKIGPAFLWGSLIRLRPGRLPGAIVAVLALTASGVGLSWLWLRDTGAFGLLWRGWLNCVMEDGSYYDASHYGSQSWKSLLLRAAKSGWITASTADRLWVGVAAATCALILALWTLRRPRGRWGRALFFALGLFPYFWFMPETFKYSLTGLALPFGLLVAIPKRGRLALAALIVHGLTISIAGLDVIGSTLFFAFQNWSLPFLSSVLLGIATARLAWRESRPRVRHEPRLGPWPKLPSERTPLKLSVIVPVPFEQDSPVAVDALSGMLTRMAETFGAQPRLAYQICVVPYGRTFSVEHSLHRACMQAAKAYPEIQVLPPSPIPARGAALREGFLVCQGQSVAAAFCEQPVAPEFYLEALEVLRVGRVDLVRGNRRLSEGRFLIPVRLLHSVHQRHGLALMWNRLLRALLPIESTDTQSGTWVASRRLATRYFAVQSQSGMGSELELALTARSLRVRTRDLPVRVILLEEKSTRRVIRESLELLKLAPRLRKRWHQGCYRAPPRPGGLSADDWGLSPGVNEAILELAQAGCLQRASILVSGRHVKDGLKELKGIQDLELGLHFNLTYADPDPQMRSPGAWIAATIWPWSQRARTLRKHASSTLQKQLEALEKLGVTVSYLDGHHHLHLLPGLLKEVAPLLRSHGIREVRLPLQWRLLLSSKWPLVVLSLLALPTFKREGWKHRRFYYPTLRELEDTPRFRARVARRPQDEYITHPSTRDDVATLPQPDSYSHERILEYRALRMFSSEWTEGHA